MTTYSFGTNPSSIDMTADFILKGQEINYIPRDSKDSWDQDRLGQIGSYNEEDNYGDIFAVDQDKFTLLAGDTVILKWSISFRNVYLLKEDGINVILVGYDDKGNNFICQSFTNYFQD